VWIKNIIKLFPALVNFILPLGILSSQTPDYKTIFSNDWTKAEAFVTENEKWMRSACKKHGIEYPYAVAVIFPELVRYSALRDKIEISLLKTLYVNLGEEYADFSIGPFQMKPSFAEEVNERIQSAGDRKLMNRIKGGRAFDDPRLYRKSIVSDLEDPEKQFIYLLAFIKISEAAFPGYRDMGAGKLKFFAAAYNCGPGKSSEYIESMSNRKFFSTKLIKSETYSYSDISVYWYKNHQAGR
jgi:hypothetical protein